MATRSTARPHIYPYNLIPQVNNLFFQGFDIFSQQYCLVSYILQAISPQDIGLGNRYHNQLAVDQLPLRLFRGDGVFEAGGTLRRPRLPSSLERPSPALAPPPVYSPHSRASHRTAPGTCVCLILSSDERTEDIWYSVTKI